MTLPPNVATRLQQGVVIPAHPLALDARRRLDERHQRALTRYSLAAGAGGLAVGVHTTQFEIHDPKVGLLRPVLELAAETVKETRRQAPVLVAGVIGTTKQAVREAGMARDLGYHLALVSLAAFPRAGDAALVEHMQRVGQVMPVMGFYLQPAVGGRDLSYDFWRLALEIDAMVAIKVAPFDRYRTMEVLRAVADSGRNDVALYTGNDDHIVLDLVAPPVGRGTRFVGGLLGQWAMWTSRAPRLLARSNSATERGGSMPRPLLVTAANLTDANGAIFDAANGFAGCISGIHEVLRRQGLLRGAWCLDPDQSLSPGQESQIDRVLDAYPRLQDDDFVRRNLDKWLS